MGEFRGNSRGFGGRDSRPRFGSSRGGRDGGRSFGGGRGFGGGRSFGGRDSRPRGPVEMTDVICDKCKKECQVPFKPSSDKPVLCRDCFQEKGGSSRGGPNRGGSGISKEQFDSINSKLDKIMKALNIQVAPKKEKKEKKEASKEAPKADEVVLIEDSESTE